MWTPCPQVLDAPIKVLGFELEDLSLLGMITTVSLVVLHFLLWIVCTVTIFVAAYYGKRGKPPGAIGHWLHEHELYIFSPFDLSLPGFLPAREITYTPA